MNQIENNQKVFISYTLCDASGQLIEKVSDSQPLAYLHGHQNIVPGLEKLLDGKEKGDVVRATIPCADGYGPYQNDLIMEVPREELADVGELEVGMEIEMFEDGEEEEEEDEPSFRLPQNPEDLYREEDDFEDEETEEDPAVFTVKEIREDVVVLDGNHPLAGKDLVFDLRIVDIVTPTVEEIEQGYPDLEDWEDANGHSHPH